MRDVALTLFIFSTLPFILRRPHIGILVWTWIGFMNPHRLTWSFAYDMPFAMIVALVTLVSLLITTIFAVYPEVAWDHMNKVAKIQLMIYVALILMQSKERINQLVWVIAL